MATNKNWAHFWSFLIQFFVVVLGVFVTLFIGTLNERSKEKRKTLQALEMIRQELVDHRDGFVEKSISLKEESAMYRDILLYSVGDIPLPPVDRVIKHINAYRVLNLGFVINVSLESAEKSGAINNVKDLSLLDAIYNSYEYVSIVNIFLTEKNLYKKEKLINHLNPGNTKLLLLGSVENISENAAQAIWEEITTNNDLFSTVVNGNIQLGLIESAINSGILQIDETIKQIDSYIEYPRSPRKQIKRR